jgi:glycosyltransferase involved in cell wall biosynthesis
MKASESLFEMQTPRITVGIPTLNRLKFLKEAVQSVLTQDYPELEVVIAQDSGASGIDDEISQWALATAKQDSRIVYFAHEAPVGLAGNWNSIVRRATGEFTMLIGDDDRLLSSCLRILTQPIQSCHVDVVFANHWVIDGMGNRLAAETDLFTSQYGRTKLKEGIQEDPFIVVWTNSIPMSSSIVRTSLLQDFKFREDLNCPELECFARLANGGGRFAFVSNRVSEYRTYGESETSKGLTLEKLFWYLESIPVPKSAQTAKKAFMKSILPGTLAREMRAGNYRGVRALAQSGHLGVGYLCKHPKLAAMVALATLQYIVSH